MTRPRRLRARGGRLPRKGRPYKLSERQAKAILEMRLSRLTGLEHEKLAKEYAELVAAIRRYKEILASPKVLDDVIVMELEEIRSKYADKRRTEIVADECEIQDEDLIQEEDMVVTISHAGYIKRTSPRDYRAQKRGGKGRIGMEARDEDWVTQLFVALDPRVHLLLQRQGQGLRQEGLRDPPGKRGPAKAGRS